MGSTANRGLATDNRSDRYHAIIDHENGQFSYENAGGKYFSNFADCNGMVLRRYSAQEKCHGHIMVRKVVDRCDASIKFGGRSSQSRSGLSSQSFLESIMHE